MAKFSIIINNAIIQWMFISKFILFLSNYVLTFMEIIFIYFKYIFIKILHLKFNPLSSLYILCAFAAPSSFAMPINHSTKFTYKWQMAPNEKGRWEKAIKICQIA
jgi:TRAP-type mannitol/chloroaromatic compound transport system permease large subunit